MLEGLDQQNTADALKSAVLKLATPTLRSEGLAWIRRLEIADWDAGAFQAAFDEHGSRFAERKDGWLSFDGTARELLTTLDALINGYLDRIRPAPGLYTTGEACEYVSERLAERGRKLAPGRVKAYIWDKHMIRGQLVGNSMVFQQEDLDAFVESYMVMDPRPGRPWHKEEPVR